VRRILRGLVPALRLPASAAMLLAACHSAAGPIRIGLAGPFEDSVGAPMLRAAQLAVSEINAAGGVRGRPLSLVIGDDIGEPDSAFTIATTMVQEGVVAVVGHVYSGTTLAAAPIYNDPAHPVAAISPSSSAPAVTRAGPWTFRVCPSDLQTGKALARFIRDRLGLTRGTVLYLNDEYGRGIRSVFVSEFLRRGGTIDEISPYLRSTVEVEPYLDRVIRQRTSGFLFIAGNEAEAEAILVAMRSRGLHVPVVGGDGLEGIQDEGDLAEGVYLSGAYLPSVATPANRAFVSAYQRAYPGAAPPNQPAAATYDILYLLRQVIGQVGTDRTRIRNRLAQIGTSAPAYDGLIGPIAFDSNGDVPDQRVLIGRVHAGQVDLVEAE
jgi:branched-chain amino acid transport system substrate-binding protein